MIQNSLLTVLMDVFNPLQDIENAHNVEDEVKILQKFCNSLSPMQMCLGDQDLDTQWLTNSPTTGANSNPFPRVKPQEVFIDQQDLNRFTFYLFERRYGWSEQPIHGDTNSTKLACQHSKMGRSSSLGIQSKFKGRINELLDDVVKWYACQTYLSEKLLKSLTNALSKASNYPVVRNQTLIHILDWLKVVAVEGFESSIFDLVKNVVVTGLTDVWSAIRIACASRLSRIIECFKIPQLECLFMELEQICKSKTSSWQAKEGAIMGMTTIIKGFHVDNQSLMNSDVSSSSKCQMYIKFGSKRLPRLPEFIVNSLYTVVFSLLSHPQLSIREHASKAFISILSRSEAQYMQKSFRQVIIHLCKGTGIDMKMQSYEKLPHHAALRDDFTFLDAYEAQGLLEVSVFLIKRIPVQLLMERWLLYFSTFNLYLMHPASTVRQASSIVFKHLVMKDTDAPETFKLVLRCLCEHWETSTATDAEDKRHPKKNLRRDDVYFKYVNGEEFLPRSSSKYQRPSILSVGKMMKEDNEMCFNSTLASTWEWREGRLFAYELILKYLIANHIHYMFPSYALSYSPRNASMSMDEAMLKRSRLTKHWSIPSYTGRDSSCSLPSTSSVNEVLEEDPKISGRSSAPGTRKEEVETYSNSSYRKRTTSFNKTSPLRLFRQSTVGKLPPKKIRTVNKAHDNSYFADTMINKAKLMDVSQSKSVKSPSLSSHRDLHGRLAKAVANQRLLKSNLFYEIFTKIFMQTIECLEDSRWELRRMSQQILPLITETIRWFDISILVDFWSQYLSRDTPLYFFAGCIALKYSIAHAGKLRQFMDQPPSTWKDVECCRRSAMTVFCSVNNGLQAWLPKILSSLRNVVIYDRITISSLEVVLARQVFLPLDVHLKEKNLTDAVVCDVIVALFLHAHPDSLCAPAMRTYNENWDRRLVFSSDEFSCFSSKGLTYSERARQVERFLFVELHGFITNFVENCGQISQILLLPVLVHSVHSFCDDAAVSQSLILSINKIIRGLPDDKRDCNVDAIKFFDLAIWELSFLILQRSIDQTVLKQILQAFLTMFKCVEKPVYLKNIFQAISIRLNYEPGLCRFLDEECSKDSNGQLLSELQLLSNDIPTSPISESSLLENDSDEDLAGDETCSRMIQESVALDRLQDSLANGSADGCPFGHEETADDSYEAFSDWDSSEELIEDSASDAIREFVKKLWMVFSENEGTSFFMQELKNCGDNEESLIRSILDLEYDDT